jgi:hypothetical protein
LAPNVLRNSMALRPSVLPRAGSCAGPLKERVAILSPRFEDDVVDKADVRHDLSSPANRPPSFERTPVE